ncbi:MAG: methyltransferase [Muribaculaceae bacterium]|nr:methyltransferase [Muribaculaceae bacterium]
MTQFQFKKFAIDDSQCAMKIGTDGVLLGAWAFHKFQPETILDIGAGSGLLSLMMAQRFPTAIITGIEIVPAAAEVAISNIQQSPWNRRIEILKTDALSYSHKSKVDAIISNPPFYDESIKPNDDERKLARHGEDLNVKSLIVKSSSLLTPGGHLALIAPARRVDEIIYLMTFNFLDPVRVTFTSSRKDSKPNRVMIEAVKGKAQHYKVNDLYLHDPGGRYSAQYKELTDSFYLESTFK